ncbi:DNA polymerase-3 subunit gamma/tau [Actinoplanes lutulentus]|uniref:DNA polymerase III subunit gamma/tau n=1 Tax=Actinoplanes lutulentus TaxID=1287878 RepID=A0A327YZP7_9ACTN|nr:DNA polymerase III subunit gamma and tau [Actinoplanes lutulentus]MBB2945640.1 DNA polymerase-3 subunit gamma/tau [Actinoplanes lutulentus]RAK27237.1 DNA polymerase-3 subunit gamma/tau [Actinoplanes lutulentus]
MALALYRKYRPRTFAEVIGQEHVTEPLSQALRSGRLNHAYLFSGPRGCGKTSSARILARSLNCEQGPTPDPCGVCMSCKSLTNDGAGSIDVIEIDAASHGGVDDAREIREKAFFAPAASRYKIYVIDEAHMVSSAGFNALLKLVEEPPEFVKFIFATTEPEKVLGTIRSRTHHYPFRLIPPAVLRPYLQKLCETEGVKVDPTVLPLVVRAGGGSARDSLSILDQLIAGAGPGGVDYARAVALLGVTDSALIDEMCEALASADGAAAYATIDRVAEAGHDPRRFASDLLERLRDLIILQQVPDAVAKGLIDGPADQLEAMAGQATKLGPATLSRSADIVHNGLVEMRGTTAPRLLLELVTARMLLPGADDSSSALLQRLERLERGSTPTSVRTDHTPPGDSGSDGSRPAMASQDPVGGAAPAAAATGPAAAGGGGGKAAAMAAAAAAAAAAKGKPVSAGRTAPVSPAPAAATPVSAPPASAAPLSAAPVSAAPVSAAPVSAPPVSAAPAVAPVSAVPVSAAPVSAVPVSAPAGDAAADWNAVAEGSHDEEPPPWDEEPVEPAPTPTPAPVPAAAPPAAPVQPVDRLDEVRAAWLELGRSHDKVGVMQKSGIDLRAVEGDTVVFGAPTPKYAERLVSGYQDVITGAFARALGGQWQIRCDVGEAAPARGPATGTQNQPADHRPPTSAPNRPASATSAPNRPVSSASAPERNSGRTESRPSRSQRPATADADDDWPEPARPADAVRPQDDAASDDDTGWPEPARPGSAGPRPPVPAAAEPVEEEAWPETAKPGGGTPAAPVDASPPEPAVGEAAPSATNIPADSAPVAPTDSPAPTASPAPTVSPAPVKAPPVAPPQAAPAVPPAAKAAPARSAAMEAARAAARGGSGAIAGGGRAGSAAAKPGAGAAAAGGSAWSDGSPTEEAPYDPEYDGPPRAGAVSGAAPRGGATIEGFDPGDEPLDDVLDEKTARQSGEELAMQLLRDAFGAEKIAEI